MFAAVNNCLCGHCFELCEVHLHERKSKMFSISCWRGGYIEGFNHVLESASDLLCVHVYHVE